MKCVIIDDEPLAIEVIESYLEKMGNMQVVAKCTSPLQAIEVINQHIVDLIFLDIEMPNLTGIDLVKSLDKPPQFIFTTAYPQYALQGFDLNATDYLVKPIPFHRFVKAVSRAKEKADTKTVPIVPETPLSTEQIQHYDEFIFVRADYANVKLYINEIRYIEGLKDYIKIHLTKNSRPVLTLSNFKNIQEKLPPNKFLRVHKSYVVNVDFITTVQKSRLLLSDTKIPLGETYKKMVFDRLKL